MSYIAFKVLEVCGNEVYSPCRQTKWDEVYAPSLGRLTYSLSAPSLEERQGIYAATLSETWGYHSVDENCRMFLVAPDPDAETEIGTKGWRTTCAIVIGEVVSLRDAAHLILASHQAGYPQVREILRWARFMLTPRVASSARDLVAQSVEVRRMVRAAAWGQVAAIWRGSSENAAGVTRSTPIRVVEGDGSPILVGQPCLKTHFKRGRFWRILYTPSTLRIEVGEAWPPLKALCQS